MFKIFSFILLLASLSSCSIFNRYFPDKNLDYQKFEAKSDLIIPDDLSSDKIQDQMPVPPISDELKNLPLPKDVQRPSSLKVGLMYLGVQKRSAGDRHWIFIDKQASQVWPELENYFKDNKLELNYFEPRKGLSETKWLNASDDYLHKLIESKKTDGVTIETNTLALSDYRVRIQLQPGLQRNTAKLQLLVSDKPDDWPKVSEFLQVEDIILDDIAKFLGERLEEKNTISLLAQQMTRKFEVDLITQENSPAYLLINQDFNQSWPLVGKAIRDAAMPLYDVNRSFGLYYLSTAHEDANKFSFTKSIKNHRQFDALKNHEDFQIYLAEEESGVLVRVQINDETSADPEFTLFVLKALQKNMLEIKP